MIRNNYTERSQGYETHGNNAYRRFRTEFKVIELNKGESTELESLLNAGWHFNYQTVLSDYTRYILSKRHYE